MHILVTFLVSVTLRKRERFTLVHSLRVQIIIVGRAWRQELEVRSQSGSRKVNVGTQLAFLSFSFLQSGIPVPEMIPLIIRIFSSPQLNFGHTLLHLDTPSYTH